MSFVYWLHLPEHTDVFSEGYIGISDDPKRRLKEHQSHGNIHILNAFKKYDNIIMTYLIESTKDYCLEIETHLRPYEQIGWNIVSGGGLPPTGKGEKSHMYGRKFSDATRRKMSRPKSEEHKNKLKGKLRSEETKIKIRSSKKGNSYRLGKIHSEETKRKISDALRGRIPWNKKERGPSSNDR